MTFDTEMLIREIESQKAIWDISSEEYSNRDLKRRDGKINSLFILKGSFECRSKNRGWIQYLFFLFFVSYETKRNGDSFSHVHFNRNVRQATSSKIQNHKRTSVNDWRIYDHKLAARYFGFLVHYGPWGLRPGLN